MKIIYLALFATAISFQAFAGDVDNRYLPDGVEIARNADGSIKRSSAMVAKFRRIHPCLDTGKTTGPCPGWQVDHIIPLACRGRDVIENMQWLPIRIKIREKWASVNKDEWERIVYCKNQENK
jgi:5-methylcytosine-specific restriction endonuclease McrA